MGYLQDVVNIVENQNVLSHNHVTGLLLHFYVNNWTVLSLLRQNISRSTCHPKILTCKRYNLFIYCDHWWNKLLGCFDNSAFIVTASLLVCTFSTWTSKEITATSFVHSNEFENCSKYEQWTRRLCQRN